jgi:hypothetical protein
MQRGEFISRLFFSLSFSGIGDEKNAGEGYADVKVHRCLVGLFRYGYGVTFPISYLSSLV